MANVEAPRLSLFDLARELKREPSPEHSEMVGATLAKILKRAIRLTKDYGRSIVGNIIRVLETEIADTDQPPVRVRIESETPYGYPKIVQISVERIDTFLRIFKQEQKVGGKTMGEIRSSQDTRQVTQQEAAEYLAVVKRVEQELKARQAVVLFPPKLNS